MIVVYNDQYGEEIYRRDLTSHPALAAGQCVVINQIEWFVQSTTFYVNDDALVVTVSDTLSKSSPAPQQDDRLAETKAAILGVQKQQLKQQKQGRLLKEQLVSLRTFVKHQKPEKKE
jgi:hypothetical protein